MSDWEEPPEEGGLTLGPDEALQREIEKSKSLKVDRLRLRDEIEKLKSEKNALAQKHHLLQKRLSALETPAVPPKRNRSLSRRIIVFALVFSVLTLLVFRVHN